MIRQRDIGHMPFPGHRTQKEVREEAERWKHGEITNADAERLIRRAGLRGA